MAETPRVVVLGSANVDLVVEVESFPAPGETVLAPSYAVHLGGKGANQAVAAARLGGRVTFVGCVGGDEHGAKLRAGLEAEGIDTRWLAEGRLPTGIAFIQVDASGQNSIVVASGANSELQPTDLSLEALDGAGALLLQLELPLDTVLAGARAARERGVTVVLNLAPAVALGAAQLEDVDVLLLNEVEAALLAGVPREAVLADAEGVAKRLVEVVPQVVVTLGGEGVAWAERAGVGRGSGDGDSTGDGFGHGPGAASGRLRAHAIEVVDTTAAGDTFAGALTAFMVANPGAGLGEAARYANAAGASAATRAGAQSSVPTAAEVAALLARDGSGA